MTKKQKTFPISKPHYPPEAPVLKEEGRVVVQKPEDEPVKTPVDEVKAERPEAVVREPVKQGPRVRYCRLLPTASFVLWFPHDEYCVKATKCFCKWEGGKRVDATLHVIAGIPQIVPAAWVSHPLVQDHLSRGKVVVCWL
jgi:hypothetical protein